jgi:hypothetical protein
VRILRLPAGLVDEEGEGLTVEAGEFGEFDHVHAARAQGQWQVVSGKWRAQGALPNPSKRETVYSPGQTWVFPEVCL